MVKALLAHEADASLTNNEGQVPLDLARNADVGSLLQTASVSAAQLAEFTEREGDEEDEDSD